jgi:hypothetical protein
MKIVAYQSKRPNTLRAGRTREVVAAFEARLDELKAGKWAVTTGGEAHRGRGVTWEPFCPGMRLPRFLLDNLRRISTSIRWSTPV